VENDAVFVLVFDFRRDFAVNDFLENGLGHGLFLQEETEGTERFSDWLRGESGARRRRSAWTR
jgi:hypothetical protein